MERPPELIRARNGRGQKAPLAAFGLGVLVAVPLLLGGGEMIARMLGATPHDAVPNAHPWAERHPLLGWTNREGSVPSHEAGHVMMTFWEGGRRKSRADPGTEEGQATVVLVGGSFTQGYGVRDEETFAWLLDEAYPDLAFENYGTGAYGTYQSLLMLEQLFSAEATPPRLVIYGFVTHHSVRNVLTSGWLEALRDSAGERFVPPYVEWIDGTLHRRPKDSIRNWPLERRSALVHGLHAGWYRWALRERNLQATPATIALMLEMNEWVRRSGSRLLVVTLNDVKRSRVLKGTTLASAERSLNCRHPNWGPQLRVGGVGHPNSEVHAHWARCIGGWIDAHLTDR